MQSERKRKKEYYNILGDSMIKHLKSYDISKKVSDCKVFVRGFGGAKVRCMKDYMKATRREKPDQYFE